MRANIVLIVSTLGLFVSLLGYGACDGTCPPKKEPSMRIGQCMYFTEADPADPQVTRKVVAILPGYYQTHWHVNGRWYVKLDESTTVSFEVMPWMKEVACP